MKKNEKIILGVIVLLLIVTIVGVSYAAFIFGQSGKNLNTVTTGIMQMSYEESSNIIKMTGALPTTDATGKARLNEGEYFDFTVSSTIQGDANINWEIAAEDFSSNTFDGSHVKLYLTSLDSSGKESEVMAPTIFTKVTTANTKTGRPSDMMSLATGTMSSSTSTKYRLRMWVDENYNPQGDGGNKKFAVRVNVYGKVADPNEVVEEKYSKMTSKIFRGVISEKFDPSDPGGYDYKDIVKIVTKNTLTAPSSVVYSEDVSEAGDGSVMAYVDSSNTLTIAADGKIKAGDYLQFKNLDSVTNIDLTYLDTSEMTTMYGMFLNCNVLTSLDVSKFNTSNVTNMSSMFFGCNALENLDVSDFNTSKVTNTNAMFAGCNSLTSLDLSSFNTSNVTDMGSMFTNCYALTSLDVSKFNTSKVTYMSYMFYGCGGLTNLNLSSFNTSKVISMISMFSGCHTLSSLNLTSFDTSNVTDMSWMFRDCTKMQSIIVSSKWVIGSGCTTTDMFHSCGTQTLTRV